jgi:hypothetical protein
LGGVGDEELSIDSRGGLENVFGGIIGGFLLNCSGFSDWQVK